MDKFVKLIQSDPALAKEFLEYLKETRDPKLKEVNKEIAKQLNELLRGAFIDFAKVKGVEAKRDTAIEKMAKENCGKVAAQLDKMIAAEMVKTFIKAK